MRRSALVCSFVLLGLLSCLQARADHVLQRLGGGYHSDAMLIRPRPGLPNHRVLKVYREWVPVEDGRWVQRSVEERNRLADQTVHDNRALKVNVPFNHRFGNVIPDAINVGDGRLLLTFRQGVRVEQLPSALQAVAKAEMAEALQLAKGVIAHPDPNPDNFLFSPETGKLTGWPDPGWGH